MAPLEQQPLDPTQRCPYCGHELNVIEVNGRGQCMTCGEKLDPDREDSPAVSHDDMVTQ